METLNQALISELEDLGTEAKIDDKTILVLYDFANDRGGDVVFLTFLSEDASYQPKVAQKCNIDINDGYFEITSETHMLAIRFSKIQSINGDKNSLKIQLKHGLSIGYVLAQKR